MAGGEKKKRKKLTAREKKKIIADYVELKSLRKVAAKYHIAPNTVKKILADDPQFAQECTEEKNACARDLLEHMRIQTGKVCTILDNALTVLSSQEKMESATPAQIATAMGILIDKYKDLIVDDNAGKVEFIMEDKLKEWSK